MPIDRKLWRNSYTTFSGFLCPRCQENKLVEQKDKETKLEPKFSAKVHGEDWWEPEMISFRFSSVLECPQNTCGEIVVVSGSAHIEQGHYEGPGGYEIEYFETFEPSSAYPAPPIFAIPKDIDDNVTEAIRLAFSLFWIDLDSCLNAIRRCVELIMDNSGIARTTINSSNKRVGLNLHTRIERYGHKNQDVAEILMALKWLGNSGSHTSKAPTEISTVLDAFEILEHAIHELYSKARKKIKKKIKTINKRKGR